MLRVVDRRMPTEKGMRGRLPIIEHHLHDVRWQAAEWIGSTFGHIGDLLAVPEFVAVVR